MDGSLEHEITAVFSQLQTSTQYSKWMQAHGHYRGPFTLPTRKSDGFQKSKDWKESVFAKMIDVLWSNEGYRLIFINGEFHSHLSDSIEGVDVLRFEQWHNEISPLNAIAELVDSIAKSGLWINVPAKLQLDKPIYLLHFNDGNAGEVASVRHHIKVNEQSSCQLVEHHISLMDANGLTLSRLSIDIGDGAQFEHVKLIEEGRNQEHLAHNDMIIGRDANAKSSSFLLSGRFISHQLSGELCHPASEVSINSLVLPMSGECFDTRTFLHHGASHCQSEQLHKIVAQGDSLAVFDGMIYVNQVAQKTDGQMNNHNLLLGDKAQVNTNPKLEIYADDVKCSHGATIGQIDPEQVFYLQARGISKPLAQQIIMKAFAAQVGDQVSIDNVRHYVLLRIEQRLESVK
ncbi:Fe-S cluster assembly protein SufD [Aliivibrio kagoshimensis]|uniref:Fe-S cluster assembly protein SufD n=1 Tax=Aliivibrio kagoshimensis TaxID=2910230 RepID=UPI003D0CD948